MQCETALNGVTSDTVSITGKAAGIWERKTLFYIEDQKMLLLFVLAQGVRRCLN